MLCFFFFLFSFFNTGLRCWETFKKMSKNERNHFVGLDIVSYFTSKVLVARASMPTTAENAGLDKNITERWNSIALEFIRQVPLVQYNLFA